MASSYDSPGGYGVIAIGISIETGVLADSGTPHLVTGFIAGADLGGVCSRCVHDFLRAGLPGARLFSHSFPVPFPRLLSGKVAFQLDDRRRPGLPDAIISVARVHPDGTDRAAF